MSPAGNGRFCQHCGKTVADYSTMTDQQILAAITNDTCGRFAPSQLDRHLTPAPGKKLLFTAVLASFLATISPSAKAATNPTVQLSVDTFSNGHKDDTSGQFLTGQVIDKVNNTSPALVDIQLKNTTLHTSTDAAGNFKLFIPYAYAENGFSLIVRSLGYLTAEISLPANGPESFAPLTVAVYADPVFSLSGVAGGVFVQTRWQRFKSRLRRTFSASR
jgi:hypothetical protein